MAATLPAVRDAREVVSTRIDLTGARDLLAVLVDQKHDLGAGVHPQRVEEVLDPLELLLI